jgi:endonuclease/exonuclease/phosphatase family metal-dependent hydrolase
MPETPPRSTLRIASYNLRGLRDDVPAAARVVRTVDPDVLLLQEVPRYPASSYAISAFARACGMLWSGRTRFLAGTTIFTSLRVDAADARDVTLPVGRRENPRGYSVARVRSPGGRAVTVASVHLPLRADQRLDHALRVLDAVVGADLDAPVVIGGDLNEEAQGAARQFWAGALEDLVGDRPTFPAARPQHRIDTVLARGHLAATCPSVPLDAGLVQRASDHLPVWVDVTF